MKISSTVIGKMLATTLFVGLSLNVACAPVAKVQTSKANQLSQAYVWYDGDREQKIWMNPQLVADFSKGADKQTVLGANVIATPVPTRHLQAGVRMWKLGGSTATAASTAIQSLQASQPAGKYSPVFHDGASNSAGMRALPGNIIVYLDPSWDVAAVDTWLKAKKLEVVKKLEIGPNIYVLKTGPGLAALDTANALYKSGEVKAAFPDWWQEIEVK